MKNFDALTELQITRLSDSLYKWVDFLQSEQLKELYNKPEYNNVAELKALVYALIKGIESYSTNLHYLINKEEYERKDEE